MTSTAELASTEFVDADTPVGDVYRTAEELPSAVAVYGPLDEDFFYEDAFTRNSLAHRAATQRKSGAPAADLFSHSERAWDARLEAHDDRAVIFADPSTQEKWLVIKSTPRTARDQLFEKIEEAPETPMNEFVKQSDWKSYAKLVDAHPEILGAHMFFTSPKLHPDTDGDVSTAEHAPDSVDIFPNVNVPQHSLAQATPIVREYLKYHENLEDDADTFKPFYKRPQAKYILNNAEWDNAAGRFNVYRNTANMTDADIIPMLGGPVDNSYIIHRDAGDAIRNVPLVVPLKDEHVTGETDSINYEVDPEYAADFYRVVSWDVNNGVYTHPQGFNDSYKLNIRNNPREFNNIMHTSGVTENSRKVKLEPLAYMLGKTDRHVPLGKRFQVAAVPHGYNPYERGIKFDGDERAIIAPDDNTVYWYDTSRLSDERLAPTVVEALLAPDHPEIPRTSRVNADGKHELAWKKGSLRYIYQAVTNDNSVNDD